MLGVHVAIDESKGCKNQPFPLIRTTIKMDSLHEAGKLSVFDTQIMHFMHLLILPEYRLAYPHRQAPGLHSLLQPLRQERFPRQKQGSFPP